MDAFVERMRVMNRKLALGWILWLGLFASVNGDLSAQGVEPFLANPTSDPLELARLVSRMGDESVLPRLSDESPVDVKLIAIRAAPHLEGPERALEALASIAQGRDPDLAPAAAHSLLVIIHALDPQALDAREVMRDELTPAWAALSHLEADETARGDIRRVASIAMAALDAVGVPH